MQAQFVEGFLLPISFYFLFFNKNNKEIIYSIRLVSGSSLGQPIMINISQS